MLSYRRVPVANKSPETFGYNSPLNLDVRSGNLFGYVPGILSVSIIVIIEKSIISFGIYLFFDITYYISRILLGKCQNSKRMGEELKKYAEYDPLKSQLEQMERTGVKLYLNGVPSTTDYIIENCVREDTVYMPDYVTDKEGKLKEIRYDLISGR